MRKIFLFSMSLIFLTTTFQSCETESLGITRVTTYPELEINGDEEVFIEVGEAYTEEGASAFIGETEVEYETKGLVNTDHPGFYNIEYSTSNADGFSITAVRRVIVYEAGLVSGLYDGVRDNKGFGGPVLIYNIEGDDYYITDLIAGYYEFGVDYGNTYAAPATINVDLAGKTFTVVSGGVGDFGQSEAKSIIINDDFTVWKYFHNFPDDDFGFDVTLTKKF